MQARQTKEFSTHRGWVTGALLLSMFMTAIEITIVATAMPRIVSELGGFASLSWVFSAYLLTQVVTIPIYGKLADLYGRKPVFLTGIVLFLIASVLCGQAVNMTQLITYRFFQGLGGGAVQPIAVTIIGDLYKPEERHRVQGWTGSVFAISSIVGPTLGAFIVDLGHWSWIFYLNVPLGILAFAIIWFYLHETKHPREHRIDYVGALLLVSSISSIMIALLEGGTAWPWISWQSGLCLALFALLMTVLLIWEKTTPEPVLPLWIFKNPLIRIAGLVTFLNGSIMIGYSAMVPTHVQGVLGQSAITAGLVLAGMSIGWPLASFFSGRVMRKIGFRKSAIIGATLMFSGTLAIALGAMAWPIAIGISMFIVGLGLGLQSNAFIVTIQSAVAWKERGVATANNLFMRTLGSSVGAAAFGGILNSTVSSHLAQSPIALPAGVERGIDLVNSLLGSAENGFTMTNRELVIDALRSGMTAVFIAAVVVSAFSVMFSWKLPHGPAHARPSAKDAAAAQSMH